MMELKFRAWDEINNEMIYHFLIDSLNNNLWLYTPTGMQLRTDSTTKLMKCTGKKDQKCIEIYDGDVLRWYPNKPVNHIDVIIGWNEYTASFYFGDWYDNDVPDTAIDSLVIGNIYQNPEYLKHK